MTTMDICQVLHCILIELQTANDLKMMELADATHEDRSHYIDDVWESKEAKYRNMNMDRYLKVR